MRRLSYDYCYEHTFYISDFRFSGSYLIMGINKRMILEEMFSETETDEHEFFMDDDEDDANFEEKM